MKQKALITAEDLWKIQRPASPALSPDGSQVCVAVTRYDMAENKGSTHLWLLSTFGGTPRELTRCGEKDGQPAWSPDGQWIAFVGQRTSEGVTDDAPQLYLIAPDGGEARRVSDIATGVSAIKWFPDSKRLTFISWVWPDLKHEKDQAKRLKDKKESKVKAHIVEHTQYRHWDHWLTDGRVPHVHVIDLDTGKCRDLFAGSPYELPVFDTDAADYDISPDGKHIVFNYNPNPDKRGDQAYQLVEMAVKSGKTEVLTADSKLTHHHPAYSPDGRWIGCLVNNLRRSMDDDNKFAVIERSSGRLRVVSHTWDRQVNYPLKWAADSGSVTFTADDQSRLSIWRMGLSDKAPTCVAMGGTVSGFDIQSDSLVFVRNNMSSAPKVFAARADGSQAMAIETFNDELMSRFQFGEVKEFTIQGWNKEAVQMWAIYPPNFDPKKKWPLLHSIHGGPHANWGDNFHFRWNNHVFAAQGYVVVCVNYHGSLGWGNTFLESNNGTWGTKEHADIEAATDFMLAEGYIDPKRLAATGGSYGGKMVAWMNGRNGAKKGGDRYRAYVCHAGCFDWVGMYASDVPYYFPYALGVSYWDDPAKVAAQNPLSFAKYMKTPTLVIHGALDYRVPDAQGMAYYNTLKNLNVPARFVLFPDENHWILKPQNSRLWYQEYFAWLEKYVGGGGKKS
ncbi:MAG: S9 family peptidase [Betaproteobacteria bacterium]|nr:S9 family peptidase [Betaproteobacteria bacterium]